jgi:hypothetical protein
MFNAVAFFIGIICYRLSPLWGRGVYCCDLVYRHAAPTEQGG